MYRSMLGFGVACVLASCAPKAAPTQPPEAEELTIITNELDDRDYKYFELDNGLKALVVSDPDADMAAASLNVKVGQFSDPWDRQGLAHFLEHMLFMGTVKYPAEDDYRKYIQDHGGRTNAGTGQENTSYFFEVSHDHLEPSLDRFAQFFIAPLLDPHYVERERNAVNSEYSLKVKEEARRFREVRRATSNPEHPFAKFSVGNHETLADRDGDDTVWASLKKFYDEEYSASRMSVAVIGREDVDTLAQMVSSRFGEVPSNDKGYPTIDVAPHTAEQLGVRVHMTPLQEMRRVTLEFPAPPRSGHFRSKPVSYITWLLGHEGEGTLFALLKQRGWIETLSAGTSGASDHTIITTSMDLTEEGYANLDEAMSLYFQYVRKIAAEGVEASRFDEKRRLADLMFRFRESPSPSNVVQSATYALHEYPPEHVINHGYVHETFDPELIQSYLSHIRPDNMRMLIQAPGLETDQVEARYDAPYGVHPLAADLMARWNAAPIDAALELPAPNPYIAERVDVREAPEGSEIPVLLREEEGLAVWHGQDPSFGVPQGMVDVSLTSDAVTVGARERVLNVVYTALLRDSMEEFGYPLRLAGVGYAVTGTWRGMDLRIQGYDDKQPELVEVIGQRIRDFKIDPARFEVERSRLIRKWRNTHHARPFNQTSWKLSEILQPDDYAYDFAVRVLESLELSELEAFVDSYFARLHARVVVQGNHDRPTAEAMAQTVERVLLADAARRGTGTAKVWRVPAGATLVRDHDIDHNDSTFLLYYQADVADLPTRARFSFLAQLMRTDFFGELRTNQQLGYIVSSAYKRHDQLSGIRFAIQSPVAGPDTLRERIEAFLGTFRDKLAAMSEDELDVVRKGMIADITKAEQRLMTRAGRMLSELTDGYTSFDRREQLVAELEEITRDEMVAFMDAQLLGEDARRVIVRSLGQAHVEEGMAGDGCREENCFGDVLADLFERQL